MYSNPNCKTWECRWLQMRSWVWWKGDDQRNYDNRWVPHVQGLQIVSHANTIPLSSWGFHSVFLLARPCWAKPIYWNIWFWWNSWGHCDEAACQDWGCLLNFWKLNLSPMFSSESILWDTQANVLRSQPQDSVHEASFNNICLEWEYLCRFFLFQKESCEIICKMSLKGYLRVCLCFCMISLLTTWSNVSFFCYQRVDPRDNLISYNWQGRHVDRWSLSVGEANPVSLIFQGRRYDISGLL